MMFLIFQNLQANTNYVDTAHSSHNAGTGYPCQEVRDPATSRIRRS